MLPLRLNMTEMRLYPEIHDLLEKIILKYLTT